MAKSLFEQVLDRSVTLLTSSQLKGLLKVGPGKFYLAQSLSQIELPSTATILDDYAFYGIGATNVSPAVTVTIKLPNTITSIGNRCFQSAAILSMNFPASIQSLGIYAFDGCISWEADTITIPGAVDNIPTYCFNACSKIKEFILQEGITEVKSYAFGNCTGMVSLSLPESLTTLQANSFYYCTALTEIRIPKNVATMGQYCFYDSKATNVYFEQPAGMTVSMTQVFNGKNARTMNVYTDNESIKNYNWSGDNITPTFYHLDGTAWE